MLNTCPICGFPLNTAYTTPQYIKYDPTVFEGKNPGDEVEVKVFYKLVRICTNKGNNDTMQGMEGAVQINPPCPNYCGEDRGNPRVVVEYPEIEDN